MNEHEWTWTSPKLTNFSWGQAACCRVSPWPSIPLDLVDCLVVEPSDKKWFCQRDETCSKTRSVKWKVPVKGLGWSFSARNETALVGTWDGKSNDHAQIRVVPYRLWGFQEFPEVSQMGYRYRVVPYRLWRFCATSVLGQGEARLWTRMTFCRLLMSCRIISSQKNNVGNTD